MKFLTKILIAVNPFGDFGLGYQDVGSISAHIRWLNQYEGVFCRLIPAEGLPVPEGWRSPYEPRAGYIYRVDEKAVKHRMTVESTLYGDPIVIPDDLQRFMPDSVTLTFTRETYST